MLSRQVQEYIPRIQTYLATSPVRKAWIFGSCSRGEETEASDVDLLVEYEGSKPVSLLTICRIRVDLSDLLNRQADVVERKNLMDFAQQSVERDKILIYERKD